MGSMKKVVVGGTVLALAVAAGGAYVWMGVNKKMELKKTQIQQVINKMNEHGRAYNMSVDHTLNMGLEQTSGKIDLLDDKKQPLLTLEYRVAHPMKTWFEEQTNTAFELKTTSHLKEIKAANGGPMVFTGKGVFERDGKLNLDMSTLQDVVLEGHQEAKAPVCPGGKAIEAKKAEEVVRFKGQTLKLDFDPKSRLKMVYTIGLIELIHAESSKVLAQASGFEYSADQSAVDLLLGKYEFSLADLVVPDAMVALKDTKMSVSTESNKPGFYDVIIAMGVRQGQVAVFNNLGAQFQYSFRGASKKVVDGLIKMSEDMSAVEDRAQKELGFPLECLDEVKDKSLLGDKAAVAQKFNTEKEVMAVAFVDSMKDDVLVNGFSTNVDVLRFANQTNYVDMSLQVQLMESKKKELLSLEDFLRWMYVVQLKGDVVKMVAPYVQQVQQLGFPVQITQDAKGVPAVQATVYYDRAGLKVNGQNAPIMYSQIIQKSLRDADRELKFQNRPPIQVQMPMQEEPVIEGDQDQDQDQDQPQPQPQPQVPGTTVQ